MPLNSSENTEKPESIRILVIRVENELFNNVLSSIRYWWAEMTFVIM